MNSPAFRTITLAALLLALLTVPFLLSNFYIEVAAKILIFAIFAMSLDLLVGYTGLVSFGHAAYFGLAAYGTTMISAVSPDASVWMLGLQAVGLSTALAMLIGLFVLRTKGIYFIMVTLAFAQMLYFIFHDTSLGGGSDGIYINAKPAATLMGFQFMDLANLKHMYGLVLFCTVLVYVFLTRFLESPVGRVLQGIRSNEHRMKAMGYATYWYKWLAFSLAGTLGGVAGFLYAVLFDFVTPELLSWHESGHVLLMLILGGMGNLLGAGLGALAFVVMQETFAEITDHWPLLMGIAIVLVVMFLPGGLIRLPDRVRQFMARISSRSAS